jgi:hypothetical protein
LAASHQVFIGMKVPRMDCYLEQLADRIAESAIQAGHTPLVAYREVARRELDRPVQFMAFVRECILASDLILILYHSELRGGLIEAGIAYGLNKPIWLVTQSGERVSSSAIGCADQLIEYQDLADLRKQLQAAFEQLARLTKSADRSLEV